MKLNEKENGIPAAQIEVMRERKRRKKRISLQRPRKEKKSLEARWTNKRNIVPEAKPGTFRHSSGLWLPRKDFHPHGRSTLRPAPAWGPRLIISPLGKIKLAPAAGLEPATARSDLPGPIRCSAALSYAGELEGGTGFEPATALGGPAATRGF